MINRSSGDMQKVVEGLMEREVKEANKVIKGRTEELLEPWKGIDGRVFNQSYLDF